MLRSPVVAQLALQKFKHRRALFVCLSRGTDHAESVGGVNLSIEPECVFIVQVQCDEHIGRWHPSIEV